MARYVRITPRVTPDVMPVFTTERMALPTFEPSAPVAVPPIVRPACCEGGCVDVDKPYCVPCWDSEIR